MKYKHIVFDIDGTLLDSEYAILRSLQETMRTLTGDTIAFQELKFALGITGEDVLKRLNIENIPLAFNLWLENMDKLQDTICPFESIPALLHALVLFDYELGIVTSKTRAAFEQEFSRLDMMKFFGTVICAEDTLEHKPAPVPLFKYMELSKASNHELLYGGDSVYDMQCAKNANVDFALACWGASSREIAADYYLEKPSDLLPVVNPNRTSKII